MKKASLSFFSIFCFFEGVGSAYICDKLGLSLLEGILFSVVIASFTGSFLFAILYMGEKKEKGGNI